jgi:hypothetical protein
MHIPLPQLEWSCFYFDGAQTNGEMPSKWWDLHSKWRFRKVGLAPEEAHLLWEPARRQVIESLTRESRWLQNELYRWKLANLKHVETLKRQVDLFLEHFAEVQRDKGDLFGPYGIDNYPSE